MRETDEDLDLWIGHDNPGPERQANWLLSRFPDAKLVAVLGLVKLIDQKEIEAADWSLTPGRHVGVAPPEVDEDFDFDQTLSDIHVELADLNQEAAALAKKIQKNFYCRGVSARTGCSTARFFECPLLAMFPGNYATMLVKRHATIEGCFCSFISSTLTGKMYLSFNSQSYV